MALRKIQSILNALYQESREHEVKRDPCYQAYVYAQIQHYKSRRESLI